MKKLLSILLSYSVLFTGCYTYRPVSGNHSGQFPSQDKNIIVTFNDNTRVKSSSYNHLYISEPSDLLYGKFRILNTRTGDRKDITGWFAEISADSCVMTMSAHDEEILTCYRGTDERIFFENVISKQTASPGFWISDKGNEINGPFQSDDIRSIQTEQLDGTKTTIFTAGVAVATLLVLGIIMLRADLKK